MTENNRYPSIADRSIDIEGINIAYKDEGSGQVILCLHALGHSSSDFASLYDLPQDKFRIIALDFPGQGSSGSSQTNASSRHYFQLTKKFIDLLGLHDCILVGNSIGGAVAIRLAENNPHIKLLALCNPAGLDKRGFLAPFFLNYMIRFFLKGVNKHAGYQRKFEKYYKKVLQTDSARRRREEITKDAYALAPLLVQGWNSFKAEEEDLRPSIKNIHCPVLFTWAMKDAFVRYSRNRQSISCFKNYTLLKYHIGHTPYVEDPDRFKIDLAEFMHANHAR